MKWSWSQFWLKYPNSSLKDWKILCLCKVPNSKGTAIIDNKIFCWYNSCEFNKNFHGRKCENNYVRRVACIVFSRLGDRKLLNLSRNLVSLHETMCTYPPWAADLWHFCLSPSLRSGYNSRNCFKSTIDRHSRYVNSNSWCSFWWFPLVNITLRIIRMHSWYEISNIFILFYT